MKNSLFSFIFSFHTNQKNCLFYMDKINFSFINLLNIVTICVTILFIFQIVFLKKKNKQNLFFSLYLTNILLILVFFLALDLDFKMTAYGLIPILLLAVLSIGPVLWIYIKHVIENNTMGMKKHLYLPIGFGIITAILIGIDFFITNINTSKNIREIVTYIVLLGLTAVFILQNIYYCYLSLKQYKNHINHLGDTYSYTEKVNLQWFKLLIYGYIAFIIGLVIVHLVDDSISYISFYLLLLIYVIFSGYNGLKQDPVFEALHIDEGDEAMIDENHDTNNQKSLKNRLLTQMKEEKYYLDPSLTIHTLASHLETNIKYLSKLINSDFNKNFVMFVNEYRIQEAQIVLKETSKNNITIEGIAYDTGFKSKSAFNRAFKKYTNTTPSAYRKENQV